MLKSLVRRCAAMGRGGVASTRCLITAPMHTLPSTRAPIGVPSLCTQYRLGSSVARKSTRWAAANKAKSAWKHRAPPAKRAMSSKTTRSPRSGSAKAARSQKSHSSRSKPAKKLSATTKRKAGSRASTTARKKVKKLSPYEKQTVKYNQRMARIESLYKDYKQSVTRGGTV